MIKAVIFDLDGVLVTTDELHYKAWKQLADEEGITGFTREDTIRQRGVSRMASLEVVLEKADRKYSDAGVQAAKAGGMRVLAVSAAKNNLQADYRADNLEVLVYEYI